MILLNMLIALLLTSNTPPARYQDKSSATIILGDKDLEIISEDKFKMEIAITNTEKLQMLIDSGNPVIFLLLGKKKYVAKPLMILSSAIPAKCDLFYVVDINGKNNLRIDSNRMTFQKIKALPHQ